MPSAPTDLEIYERIVGAILDHRLPPGTKLVEDRLAGAFGVSRTRIRPVLARLAGEQLVTLTPNRGATIARPSEQEAREVFEVRRLVEPTLAQRFMARASAADLQRLARCIEEEEAARAERDQRRAIRLSGEFHLLIAECAGHRTLGRLLRELVSRTSLVLMTYGPPVPADATACGCTEHRALLAAMRGRDTARLARLMDAHLRRLEAGLVFAPPAADGPDLGRLFAH
jgi:DNA-binding GntR family transcriptional regulator